MKKNRYPGIHSFTEQEHGQFFGRERETKELYRLLVLNPVVVLFGKSGTGKTSLLQAGVSPLLHGQLLQPLKLRLNDTSKPIARQLWEQFNEHDYLPDDTPDDLTLSEYCRRFDCSSGGEAMSPVLLLDQFEELFTLYTDLPEQREAFIGQLSELVNRHATDLEAVGDFPKVRIVISIRSDFLYLLDRLSTRIPAILRCRYELRPLDESNARQAIMAPAQLPGDFATERFEYSEAALNTILDGLSAKNEVAEGEGREVEAFLLQQFCQRIESKVIGKATGFQVTPDFFGDIAGIEAIRDDFYADVLEKFKDPATLLNVQRLVEEKLISGGRRILAERENIKTELHLSGADLKLLCDERLLVQEVRGNSFYYEISHDTLLAPILRSRMARLEREQAEAELVAKAEALQKAKEVETQLVEERRRAEEAERLKNEAFEAKQKAEDNFQIAQEKSKEAQQQKAIAEEQTAKAQQGGKRARTFAYLAGLVAAVAIGLGIFAFLKQNEAKNASDLANAEEAKAKNALTQVEKEKEATETQRKNAEASALLAKQKADEAEGANAMAQTNLTKAKVEEAKAKAALEQVEREKTATEAQRQKAEESFLLAQEKTKEAEKQAQAARMALDAQQKAVAAQQVALTEIAKRTISDAQTQIYHLDYEDALATLQSAAALQAAQKEVSDALLEIVFFFAETERFDRAKGVLDTAAQLAGRPLSSPANGWKKHTDFRRAIKSLNPERDTFLAARYFPTMLPIPGGTDTIGDNAKEKHAVTLSPFKMAKTETTWWQYNLFCEATGNDKPNKPSWGSDGDNPVVNVRWYDAVAYANWLSEREGRRIAMGKIGSGEDEYEINLKSNSYRLPTEAEWEYAARARAPFEYAGSSDLDSVAWYDDNSKLNGVNRTHPVAGKKANAFGLCDMSGNVWEWCWDWYADYDKNAVTNPTGAEKGDYRVYRGGGWVNGAEGCRVSFRGSHTPTFRNYYVGFRLSLQ